MLAAVTFMRSKLLEISSSDPALGRALAQFR